jgi:hypothetical protein
MNALIPRPMDGELLAPADMVRAVGKTHPMNGGRIDCYVRAGLSITEILLEALSERPGSVLRRDFVVHIDGYPIEEKNWSRIRVKSGATVTFVPRLQGGNVLRTVLSVVVAVAALVFAGPIAGAIGLTALVGGSVATALVGAGIIFAGTMALNALFPTRPQALASNETGTAPNSIQGAQNQSSPFGAIPVVLGTHRQSPFYGAKPYTEIIGDDQYLRLLFCFGYGPMQLDQRKIGETLLSTFEDCEVQAFQGFLGDPPVSLYPGSVDEVALSIEMTANWQYQTTADETDEISLDFTATGGIYQVNAQSGNLDGYATSVSAQYSVTGSGVWLDFATVVFTRATQVARKGVRLVVPRGQYDVRVLQDGGGPRHDDRIKDTIVWTAIRSFKNVSPINFPQPLALIALRIRASNQLSGVISTFNLVCSALTWRWDGAAWQPNQVTSNPASAFRLVLQGPANARPVAYDQIDFNSLQAWSSYCDANGFTFNQVRTTATSVYDVLADIAAAGRAVPTFIDGKWGVIWDRPNDTIVQHFTPRNSWGFSANRTYPTLPHGWRVKFINSDNGYTEDERIVYDDGYNTGNATLFEGIEFPGVTDPALIWKHGRFHIAQARLRPETITIQTGWENIVCTRGDRVAVTHDVLMIGLASGRVKSVVGQVVTFDETVTTVLGTTYGFQFRVPGIPTSIVRAVDSDTIVTGEFNSLTLVGDLSQIESGTLFGFGETDQEAANYRVKTITHAKDLIATLTLVDDAPEISQADQGAIPAYDPHVSVPPDPFTLAPQDLRYQPAVEGQGDAVRAITILTWQSARRGRIVSSEVQYLDGLNAAVWQPFDVLPYPQMTARLPLIAPGVWSFRVRFIFDDGATSAWTSLNALLLLGLTGAPDDVQNIRGAAYVDDTGSISWDEVEDYRPIRYAVRKGDAWESALELGTVAHPPFAAHGNGLYLVKAYCGPDSSRAYSVNAAQVDIAGASLVKNVIATRDEKTDGWNGVYTGTVAKSGVLIRTGGSSDILSEADFLGTPDILNLGGQGDGTYEIAKSRYIDARRATACRVTITWKGTGQTATDDMLSNPDILNNPDFLAAGSTDLVEVYPEISVAQNDFVGDVFNLDPSENPGNDIFAEPDVFSSDVSFGPWIKYEPGMYVGRWFRARMVLKTHDPQVTAICLEFTFSVDVPDRVDTWALVAGVGSSLNLKTIPAAGLDIVFASNGKTIAEPFNGGPNADALPLIQITNTSASNFDFEVTNLTKSGCTIIPRLAGVPTDAPKTNITIQGW